MTAYQKIILGLFAAFFLWSAVGPSNRAVWLLENLGVIVFTPFLVEFARRGKLSSISYTMLFVFLALHMVGAHYTYEKVPFGEALGRAFGSERNLYDQFVHFSFGLLATYPLHEFFIRTWQARAFWGYAVPFIFIMALAAGYEVAEWAAAFILHPAESAGFLGSQGDFWDTQKDMAAAGAGALVALFIASFFFRKDGLR